MSMRITQKDLEDAVGRLNRLTNNPLEEYTKVDTNKWVFNLGNYHLHYAYGQVKLRQNSKIGGSGTSTIFSYNTKRDLFNAIQAYIAGFNTGYIQGEEEALKLTDDEGNDLPDNR